jgi:hypothetical protein
MWYRIGRGPTRDYYYANVDLIRASQISMAASFALFMAGLAAPGLSDLVHGELMTMGLLSFYLSVMYLQHPAFTNSMPKRPLSYVLLALFALGAAGRLAHVPFSWAPFSALYIALYIPGLRGRNAPPNILTMAGLAALAFAGSPWQLAMSFPAASAMSLMLRVDSAKRKFSVGVATAVAFAAVYLASIFSPLPRPAATALAFAAFLAVVRGVYISREPYAWGTAVGRLLPLLSPAGLPGPPRRPLPLHGNSGDNVQPVHTLVRPVGVPKAGAEWRSHLQLVPIAASALRLTGVGPLVGISAVLLMAGGAYAAYAVLRERAFPLGPPP